MEFEHYLENWCESNSIAWEYDPVKNMHTFTLKPLDPMEASLQECFGDTRFPQCTVSPYVLQSVKSVGVDMTCLTDMITRRLKISERLVQ